MTEPWRPLWILVLIPLVAAACTAARGGDGHPTAPATKAPTPRGWMLSSGQVFGQGLTATHLPDGDPQRMGLPNDALVFDAIWVQPGATAAAFVQSGSDPNALQLEEVGMTGTATLVGDPIVDNSAISAAGSVFLASSCSHGKGDTMVVPAGGSSWQHVVDACQATLAPDGRSLAFTTDGHTIQSMPVAGGTPETVVDLDRIAGSLRGADIEEMSWGSAGLGVVLSRGRAFDVLVHTDQGDHGEIKRSSQHLETEELRWEPESDGGLIVRCGLRCVRPVDHRWDGVSTGSGSGKESRVGCRARRPASWLVCLQRSEHVGSAKVVACQLSASPSCLGATCPSSSVKRSPSSMPAAVGYARSLGGWVVPPRRSRGSCVGTPQPVAGTWSIGPRRPSGTPTAAPGGRRLRSSPRTMR